MISAEVSGPGGATPSAPKFPVPEFSLRFYLDRRDALVLETLLTGLSGPQKASSIGLLVAGSMGYGIAADHYRQILIAPTHLFTDLVKAPVAVPTTGFDFATPMAAFVEKWEGLAKAAVD